MQKKHIAIAVVVLLFISVISAIVMVNDNISTETGAWSQVEYTDSLLVGYPEYYQLVLEFSSLGPLPNDLQKKTNYTGTVFIAYYNIRFNISGLQTIDRERSSDEWIGVEKPLEMKFAISEQMAENATSLEITIEFKPHNYTDILNNDIFQFVVDFRYAGTGSDILFSFSVTMLPVIILAANWWFYKRVNAKFIRNVTWKRIPKYYSIYIMKSLKNSLLVRISIIVALISGIGFTGYTLIF